jgi:hypothetical protein
MISSDNYTLELQEILSEKGAPRQVRAIAENVATRSTVEMQFSVEHAEMILAQVYKGDHLSHAIEQLATGYPTELLSAAASRCFFTSKDLVGFGFDPSPIRMLESGDTTHAYITAKSS